MHSESSSQKSGIYEHHADESGEFLPYFVQVRFSKFRLTSARKIERIESMRNCAILVLTALIAAICSPLTVAVTPAGDIPYLAALDVCSTSHAAISVNADSPAIQECSCGLSPLAYIGYMNRSIFAYHPAVFTIKIDRPPIA